jgi:DNA-binding CsgD family transcriptional regulator
LGVHVPKELNRLSKRERQCLEMMAQGKETRTIAKKMHVSVSTIHTHMKRAREKLGLHSVEALISFAARYCFPADRPLGKLPSVA